MLVIFELNRVKSTHKLQAAMLQLRLYKSKQFH